VLLHAFNNKFRATFPIILSAKVLQKYDIHKFALQIYAKIYPHPHGVFEQSEGFCLRHKSPPSGGDLEGASPQPQFTE